MASLAPLNPPSWLSTSLSVEILSWSETAARAFTLLRGTRLRCVKQGDAKGTEQNCANGQHSLHIHVSLSLPLRSTRRRQHAERAAATQEGRSLITERQCYCQNSNQSNGMGGGERGAHQEREWGCGGGGCARRLVSVGGTVRTVRVRK